MSKWFNNLVKMIDEENKNNQVITEPDSDPETAGEKAEEKLNKPDEPPEPDEPGEPPEPDGNNDSNDNND